MARAGSCSTQIIGRKIPRFAIVTDRFVRSADICTQKLVAPLINDRFSCGNAAVVGIVNRLKVGLCKGRYLRKAAVGAFHSIGQFGLRAVIHRNLVTVCCVAQSSPSWLEIRALTVNVRFHQQRTLAAHWTNGRSADKTDLDRTHLNWPFRPGPDLENLPRCCGAARHCCQSCRAQHFGQ